MLQQQRQIVRRIAQATDCRDTHFLGPLTQCLLDVRPCALGIEPMHQQETPYVTAAPLEIELRLQLGDDRLAKQREDLLRDQLRNLLVSVVERGQGRCDQTQIEERSLLMGVANDLEPAGACGRQRFLKWFQHPRRRPRFESAQLDRLDRGQLAGDPGLALSVEDGIHQRGQFQKRPGGGLFVALDEPFHRFADFREHRSFLTSLLQRLHELLQAEVPRRDDAASDRQPPHFIVGLNQDGNAHNVKRITSLSVTMLSGLTCSFRASRSCRKRAISV